MDTTITRCFDCGARIRLVEVQIDRRGRMRKRGVGVDVDPEGRVVWWNDRWLYVTPERTMKVPPDQRYKLHGWGNCTETLGPKGKGSDRARGKGAQ